MGCGYDVGKEKPKSQSKRSNGLSTLFKDQKTWLVTGCAGFIGSNIVQELLVNDQKVIGVDNLITGRRSNLEDLTAVLGDEVMSRFEFREQDLLERDVCDAAVGDADIIIHQAALGSVPRSIERPLDSHRNNVEAFVNLLSAMKDHGGRRFVYASSSSVYGDHPDLPKVEAQTGNLLSPYALTKQINEEYADVFARVYDFEFVGLRYFNVFGRRQDPDGAYAAVIPKWTQALIRNEPVFINGDGDTSRDFTYIDNVVQINLKAALTDNPQAVNRVYNVAVGERTTLNQLYSAIKEELSHRFAHVKDHEPTYRDFRPGDIRHSLADVSAARELLKYAPDVKLQEGLKRTMDWYVEDLT